MPRDPRKHQKALMKKRSKEKASLQRTSNRQASTSLSPQAIIRRARAFPFLECWISANWQKDDLGLVEILLGRQQPDGDICFGVYLVDKYCLGLKNTFANAGFSHTRYQNEVFGKNGKPFFVAGPHDNVARILKQLEKTAGPGNYDYFAPLDAF